MDNLRVHHSKLLDQFFMNVHFVPQFLPPQSCELNPIEKVWALLKGEYRKTAHQILEVEKSKKKLTEAAMIKIKEFRSSFD